MTRVRSRSALPLEASRGRTATRNSGPFCRAALGGCFLLRNVRRVLFLLRNVRRALFLSRNARRALFHLRYVRSHLWLPPSPPVAAVPEPGAVAIG